MNEKCCGCSACALICPVNAIEMKVNQDGFYRPVIDKNKCINCKLCYKACFYEDEDTKIHELAKLGLFSANTKNEEIRSTTSSGGIANEIAQYALENNQNVCAVIYDKESREARHINIEELDEEQIDKIKGSKYIQSKNEEGFRKALSNNRKTIIFGTPCQIAGFSKIIDIKKIREKFILIDIYCHGVPSYNLWNKYLDYITKKYNMEKNPNVIFREKKLGWHNYFMKITSENKEYIKIRDNDIFYLYFLNSKCNSESCYNCKFRNNSCADIRLGDYWGTRYRNEECGYSMVCVNTVIGKELLKNISNKIELKETNINERFSQQTSDIIKPKEYEYIKKDLKKSKPHFYRIMNKYKIINLIKGLKKIIKQYLGGE